MRKWIIGLVIAFSVGLIGTLASLPTVMNENGFQLYETKKIDETKTYEAKGIQRVTIENDIGNVHIYPSNDSQIRVHVHGERLKSESLRIYEKKTSNELTIDIDENVRFFGFTFGKGNIQRQVDVYVPESKRLNAFITTDVGKITVDPILLKSIHIENEMGQTIVKSFKGKDLNVASEIGQIDLTNINANIHVETEMGEINIRQNEINNHIFAKSEVGPITISSEKTIRDANFQLSSDIGEVEINAAGMKQKGNHSFASVIGKGTYMIQASTDAGTISVK